MELLVYFSRHAGEVISTDQLMADVWGRRVVEESAIYKRINQLRGALGDNAHDPQFIETIPKRGYRLVAAVEGVDMADTLRVPKTRADLAAGGAVESTVAMKSRYRWIAAAIVSVTIAGAALPHGT